MNEARPELTTIETARELVLGRVPAPSSESVALREALGRVLAAPVAASDDVPGFDNSAMDGFAVRAADTAGAGAASPRALALVDESRAGHPGEPRGRGRRGDRHLHRGRRSRPARTPSSGSRTPLARATGS